MNHSPDRRATAVAIVSSDPMVAALLGAAVELLGYRVEFPRAEESASDAVRRARPAVLLLDVADPAARDEVMLGRVLMRKTRICLFGTERQTAPVQALAHRFDAHVFVLPRDAANLEELLSRRLLPQPQRLTD